MEPIGTITMYFPFLDSKTKGIIENIMHGAYNYYDFVQCLNQRVLDEETTDLTVFFAVHHAAILFDFQWLKKAIKKYAELNIILPNIFIASAFQGHGEDLQRAREAADIVLDSNPPKWLALEMYISRLEAEVLGYPTQLDDRSTIDSIEEIMEKNPELRFYESRVYGNLSYRADNEGDKELALNYIEKAISNAEVHNDLNRLARLLRSKARHLQAVDLKQSADLLERARGMFESMGDKDGLADASFQLSKIEAIRGEYDQAIEHILEVIAIRESLGRPIGPYAMTLSTIYNAIDCPTEGIEWALMAQEDLQPLHRPRAILNQAWSLILQRKLTEAFMVLDSIRKSILKSGLEYQLAALYLINGVLDMVEGNHSGAAVSLEESLEIYERQKSMMSAHICSHYLARNEFLSVDSLEPLKGVGPWLTLLEERAISEDLPGILAQALILKSQLFMVLNNQEEFNTAIQEAAILVESANLTYLKDKVSKLLESA
ncbi:MAG: type IV pilus biogenesis/stability protein PilW [Candidatus Thorarchaeota archaeon]